MPKKRVAPRKEKSSKSSKGSVIRLSQKQVTAKRAKQKVDSKTQAKETKALKALRKFRPRKSERDSIIMIGTKGARNPSAKGRKGYLVLVDKKGKKHLVKGYKKSEAYTPKKITDFDPVINKKTRAKFNDFKLREMVRIGKGHVVGKYTGSTRADSKNDFNDKVVKALVGAVQKALTKQVSHRVFNINANVTIIVPGVGPVVRNVQVTIANPDRITIAVGGIENFIKYKFYAQMAQILHEEGYVTSGSANHVRRLEENNGLPQEEWTYKDDAWKGQESEIVRIDHIDWIIEQAI